MKKKVFQCVEEKKFVVKKKNIIQNRKFRNVENDIRIFFPLEIPFVLLEHLKKLPSEDLLTSFSSIIFCVSRLSPP